MRGGIKVYRGSPAGARAYLEADRSRADDYYLTEGSGLAVRYIATRDDVFYLPVMDGDTYQQWVSGVDLETGELKGRIRTDASAVRFVEVVVNGPKTWSIAAAAHSDIAAAYDAAQDQAAREIIAWLARHATTRVGPRGRQVQVRAEEIEAAVVRHYTSRAGDPHRHLHLQINARVFAHGGWRGIHTVGVRDSLAAINGIGHAAVMCDPGFRAALAAHGYQLDLSAGGNGEVVELKPFVGVFSARAAQIGRHLDRYETEWRADHPGEEPGPRLRRSWDARAWAEARPDKVHGVAGAVIEESWTQELRDLGFRPPILDRRLDPTPIGQLDRDAAVELVLTRLAAARSAWNTADIRGQVEHHVAEAGVVADAEVRGELVEDLVARTVGECVRLLDRDDVPEHIRSLTSTPVLQVEDEIITRLAERAEDYVGRTRIDPRFGSKLDPGQLRVASAIAGYAKLMVVDGAAGAGKSTTLRAAALHLAYRRDTTLTVVTPTLKAAQVFTDQVGVRACSAAQVVHAHGFRWDDDGRWTRIEHDPPRPKDPGFVPGVSVLVIDEAGMLDQDTCRALLNIADEKCLRLVFMGDRHQLPAVGRGGVLDHAHRWARPSARHTLDILHRFTDAAYADLSLQMRTAENPGHVFDQLLTRGEIVIHVTGADRISALTQAAVAGGLVIAESREDVAHLNATIRDHHHPSSATTDRPAHQSLTTGSPAAHQSLTTDPDSTPSTAETTATALTEVIVVTDAGEQLGVGDRVATRRNDRDLGVSNRDTWTITAIGPDGTLHVHSTHADHGGRGDGGAAKQRTLPAAYVQQHVELAYATTAYGAQGATVDDAHLLLSDTAGAAATYVAMTRGRHHNTAHLVAESVHDARDQWIAVFTRDNADLGPTDAANRAVADIDRYGSKPSVAYETTQPWSATSRPNSGVPR